jgi:RNA polymerase sigma factor (sigma-70 family)
VSDQKMKFWKEIEPTLHGIATYKLAVAGLPADMAKDTVQQAWLRFDRTISQKRKSAWRPELYKTIDNLVIDAARMRNNHLQALPHVDLIPSNQPSPEKEVIDRDLRQQADAELSKKLLPAEREALRLHLMEKKTHKEIGILLEISDRTVRRHIAAGIEKATAFLNENRDRFSF